MPLEAQIASMKGEIARLDTRLAALSEQAEAQASAAPKARQKRGQQVAAILDEWMPLPTEEEALPRAAASPQHARPAAAGASNNAKAPTAARKVEQLAAAMKETPYPTRQARKPRKLD